MVAWGLRPCTEAISPDKLPFPAHGYTPECSPRSPPPTAVFHSLSTVEGQAGGGGGGRRGVENGAFCFRQEMMSLKIIQESKVFRGSSVKKQ